MTSDFVPGRLRGLLLATFGLALLAGGVAGQEGCEFVPPGNDLVRSLTIGGIRTTYITNPHFLCAGGVEILADSAEVFPDRGMSHLIGDVRYFETSRELLADDARYFTNEGRLQANGNVRITDEAQGSSIVNGDLVYLLQTDFREQAELTVTTGADGLRPVAVLRPPPPAPDTTAPAADSSGLTPEATAVAMDSSGATPDSTGVRPDSTGAPQPAAGDTATAVPPDSTPPVPAFPPRTGPPVADTTPVAPYTVVGDRIFLLGSGYFTASGTVEITQDSLRAFADSAEYDAEGEGLVLERAARVVSAGYDLVGRSITMSGPGAARSVIHARREARLEGDDLQLTSAQIFLFLSDGALDRLVATPIVRPSTPDADSVDLERPRADVQDFVLTADSLEVLAPGETIERVFAAGRARSESSAGDSLNVELLPEIARSDWLEGDTVVVTFALPPDAPSGSPSTGPRRLDVDEIVAVGSARTLYRLPPNDSTARAGTDPPAVHYVVGQEIRIRMEDREVSDMQVSGQTRGVHLEPLQRRPGGASGADSTATPDTSMVIDTLLVAQPRQGREPATLARVRQNTHNSSKPEPRSRPEPGKDERPWNRPWMS